MHWHRKELQCLSFLYHARTVINKSQLKLCLSNLYATNWISFVIFSDDDALFLNGLNTALRVAIDNLFYVYLLEMGYLVQTVISISNY